MKIKENKGITLIALVITIIVLLILAGVTINMVLGDNGIIGQAQHAKQQQDKAKINEDETLKIGQGNIDLYTEGTLANKVKVGDYVKYNYDAPDSGYKIPTSKVGNNSELTFKSSEGENAAVTEWRVLSRKDGIVKLVSAGSVVDLALNGENGYINGPLVLNEMCKTLYSSDKGTARSIKIEDVDEIKEYDGKKYYNITSGDRVEIQANETKTIGKIAEEQNYNISSWKSPELNKEIKDYEVNFYYYDLNNNSPEKTMLQQPSNTCWLASQTTTLDLNDGFACNGLRTVGEYGVGATVCIIRYI